MTKRRWKPRKAKVHSHIAGDAQERNAGLEAAEHARHLRPKYQRQARGLSRYQAL